MAESDGLKDALSLSLRYLKQETLGPAKRLTGFVAFGLVATAATGIGLVLVGLGLLRLLQTETGTALSGHLNWLPYLIVLVVMAAAATAAFLKIGKRR